MSWARSLSSLALLALSLAPALVGGCSKENDVDQSNNASTGSCAEKPESLAKLCPAGTSLDLTAEAQACSGGDSDVKDAQGNVTARCRTFAGCSVRCALLSVCGNGQCELNERKECKADDKDCVPCAKDCGDAVCGDTICNGSESPQSCPQDCAGTCAPGATRCKGSTAVLTCSADGKTESETACPSGKVCGVSANGATCNDAGVCGNGACETGEGEGEAKPCAQDCKKAVCGNGACELGESAQSCAEDCGKAVCGNGKCEQSEQVSCPQDCGGSKCVPNAKYCVGPRLFICQPDGAAEKEFDCADFDQTCGKGACVPKGTCGNGACEESDPSGCVDCATDCGNGTCDPGESVETCGSDCKKPACGDGVCSVSEAGSGCADCAASCGNGACDAGESRSTCPKDCGYCGNGVCDAGAESSVQLPPGGAEYCPQDCIKAGACSSDAQCDDKIACTVDRCVGGSCTFDVPSPVTQGCGPGTACVLGFGCCPDADGDGFGCCGGDGSGLGCKNAGGDCNDNDTGVHPGAAEVCGGGDTNCSGGNVPQINLAPLVVTKNDLNDKQNLSVAFDGARYFFSWGGKPAGAGAVMGALADKKGALLVPPKVIVEDPKFVQADNVPRTRAVVAPVDKGFAVAWGNAIVAGGNNAGVVWVDDKLETLTQPQNIGGVWNNYLLFTQLNSYYALSGSWIDLNSEVSFQMFGPTKAPVTSPGGLQLLLDASTLGKQFVFLSSYKLGGSFQPPGLVLVDTDGNAKPKSPLDWGALSAEFTADAKIAVQRFRVGDGPAIDAVAIATPSSSPGGGLYYMVSNLGGKILFQAKASSKTLAVEKVVYAAQSGAQDDGTVGILARDGDNLVFLARKSDGSELLPDSIVGGGPGTSSPTLVFDGTDFVVIWLMPDKNNIQQVHLSRVSCQ